MRRKKKQFESLPQEQPVVQSNTNAMQAQTGPFPMMQSPGAKYVMPNLGAFEVVSNGMPLGLPQFTSIDEFGRPFTPIMSYQPQPNSAPVPIATPPQFVQLTPIVSPVAFVPYSTQEQALYQYDED